MIEIEPVSGDDVLRIVVIGGGLIGSAAAKYLGEAGHEVTVLAPREPDSSITDDGYPLARPLASHYDEGRITRITDRDRYWADVARRSIERYRSIEEQSGVEFYTERPLVYLADDAESMVAVAAELGADVAVVDPDRLATETGVHRPPGYGGAAVVESAPAGFVNPRRMVAAQLIMAAGAGAVVVPEHAVEVAEAPHGVSVTAADGSVHHADRVLLATGAYGADLLGVDLSLERRLRTVALLELTEPGPDLPVLIVSDLDRHGLGGIYWVPPVVYPDGGTYLKIGGDLLDGNDLRPGSDVDATDAIARWFAVGGSTVEVDALTAVAAEILPDRGVRLAASKPCVVTYTADHRPAIGWVGSGERIATAVAGCGAAGKSADAIGHDAARFVLGR